MTGLDIELQPTVIEPRTGETLTLATASVSQLVDVFLELEKREKQFREWRTAVEDELVRRHEDNHGATLVDKQLVDIDRPVQRKWDPEDLIETVSDLVGRGLLTIMDAQGLVRDEPKVDGRKAAALLAQVDGEALVELRKCFTWQKGRARVKVTPITELEA